MAIRAVLAARPLVLRESPVVYLLANAPEDFINASNNLSSLIRGSFESAWPLWLGSGLYKQIGTLGLSVAIPFAGIWAYKWLFQEGSYISHSGRRDLALLLLVLVLIGSPTQRGSLLGQLTHGVHRVSYSINDTILQGVNQIVGSSDVVTEVGAQNAARTVVELAIERCGAIEDKKSREGCYDSAEGQMKAIIDSWVGGPFSTPAWTTQLYNELFQRLQVARAQTSTRSSFFLGNAGKELSGITAKLASSIAMGFLMATGTAFLLVLEIVSLGTALIGPFAVGASLIPVGGRPFVGWATGFLALAIARLTYGLVITIMAFLFYTGIGGLLSTAVIPIVVGFLGPLIAVAAATGGGLAIFNGLLAVGAILTR